MPQTFAMRGGGGVTTWALVDIIELVAIASL